MMLKHCVLKKTPQIAIRNMALGINAFNSKRTVVSGRGIVNSSFRHFANTDPEDEKEQSYLHHQEDTLEAEPMLESEADIQPELAAEDESVAELSERPEGGYSGNRQHDDRDDNRPQMAPENQEALENAETNSRVKDKLTQLKEQQAVSVRAGEVAQLNIGEIQASLKLELGTEKVKYLAMLERQESLLKKDTTQRVFQLVGEIGKIHKKENALLDEKIKEKRDGVSPINKEKVPEELAYERDIRRKDLLVSYSNLRTELSENYLPELVTNFGQQSEAMKRDIFKSIKIYYSKEQAKIELLKEDQGAQYKQERMESHEQNMQRYQDMLKAIIPQHFQQEYLSLKQIKARRSFVNDTFQKVENQQIEKLQNLKTVQTSLNKHEKSLDASKLQTEVFDMIVDGGQDPSKLQTFEEFDVRRKTIEDVKQALSQISVPVLEKDREIERQNQKNQSKAEYEQQQMLNLMRMGKWNLADTQYELRQNAFFSNKRYDFLDNNQVMAEDQIRIENKKVDVQNVLAKRLRKYNIDISWFNSKSTEQLNELANEYEKSVVAEVNHSLDNQYLSSELEKIGNKVLKNQQNPGIFKARVRALQHATGLQDDMITNQLLQSVEDKSQQRARLNPDPNQLQNEFKTSDIAWKQVQPPSRTVFDQQMPEREKHFVVNKQDQRAIEETLSYNNYKIRQIKTMAGELEEIVEEPLIKNMAGAKRNAWINIYNEFLDAKGMKKFDPSVETIMIKGEEQLDVEGLPDQSPYASVKTKEDFYELFRDWKVKETLPVDHVYLKFDANGNKLPLVPPKTPKELREEQNELDLFMSKQKFDYKDFSYLDPENRMKDSIKQDLDGDIKSFNDSIYQIEKEIKGPITSHRNKEVVKEYEINKAEIELKRKEWQEAYGEELMDNNMIKEREIITTIGGINLEKYGLTEIRDEMMKEDEREAPEQELNEKEGKEEAEEEAEVDYNSNPFTPADMKLLDDRLLRQIEAHLAGVPRISDEYGVDHEFEREMEGKVKQIFDGENYEKYKESQSLETMSKLERQQELVFRRKREQVSIELALKEREWIMQEVSNEQEKQNLMANANIDDLSVLKNDLENVERKVLAKLKREAKTKEKREKKDEIDPVVLLRQKMSTEHQLISQVNERLVSDQSALAKYIQEDKFGQTTQLELAQEEARLEEMAQNFEPFDLYKVVQLDHQSVFLDPTGGPISSLQAVNNAESSSQIIEAAKHQNLSREDQSVAALYQKDNSQREEYLQVKYQMYLNQQIKKQLATKILLAQDQLFKVNQSFGKLQEDQASRSRGVAFSVLPMKYFNFIQMEQNITKKVAKAAHIAKRIDKFDPKSKHASNYNEELRMQLGYLKLKSSKKSIQNLLDQIQYLQETMSANKVRPDIDTNTAMFEISLIAGSLQESNGFLKKVQDELPLGSHSTIGAEALQTFFDQSLKKDNFDGLAFLITHAETHGVDTSSWDMSRFRSALDFYLNHSFDLNKVLTFTRFYAHHAASALDKSTGQDEQKFEQAFGKLEGLVDMKALFSHLVDKIGTKTFIDPQTKQDPMVNLIEFYSRSDVQQVSRLSEEATTSVSSKDMAKYLINHLDEPSTFERITDSVLGLEEGSQGNDLFVNEIIQGLKLHQTKKRSLPKSFSPDNIRNRYIDLKSQDSKLSEKTAEFFFCLFQQHDMLAESIDLSENYQTMVRGIDSEEQANLSDIRNYYTSEALLGNEEIAKDNRLNEILEAAVFRGKQDGAAFTSQMTKAYMLDGNMDHALRFFEGEVQKRRTLKEAEKEQLISLFDSTFGGQKDLNKDIFKEQYLSMMMSREQIRKEMKAIDGLDCMLQNCDKEEIDNIFMLHIVLREERELLKKVSRVANHDFAPLLESFSGLETKEEVEGFVKDFGGMDIVGEIMTMKDRKRTLEGNVERRNRDRLIGLMDLMDDGKVQLLGEVYDKSEALKKLGLSEQQYQEYIHFDENKGEHQDVMATLRSDLGLAKSQEKVENDRFMTNFNKILDDKRAKGLEYAKKVQDKAKRDTPLSGHIHAQGFEEKYDIDIEHTLEYFATKTESDPVDQENLDDLKKFKEYVYLEDLNEKDPTVELEQEDFLEVDGIALNLYDRMVHENNDELTDAYDSRKKTSLQYLLKAFNRIQGISFKKFGSSLEKNTKTFTSGEINVIAEATQQQQTSSDKVIDIGSPIASKLEQDRLTKGYQLTDPAEMQSSLEEFDSFLNSPQSPLISNFMHLMDYKNGSQLETYHDWLKLPKDQDKMQEFSMHANFMESQMQQIDQMAAGVHQIGEKLKQDQKVMNQKKTRAQEFSHQWKDEKNKRVTKVVGEKIDNLYNQFSKIVSGNKPGLTNKNEDSLFHLTCSDEEKVRIMHQALMLEDSSFKTLDVFNSFYSQDLIVFGMKNNIPEAVRLGEKMLSENNGFLSFEMAKAVKTYKLEHSQSYQEAIRRTGPINYNNVYSKLKPTSGDQYDRNSIVNMDDPYWQEFMEKNFRSQDKYKVPSGMAWDFKPNGIFDEIFDMKKLEQNAKELQRMM